MGKWIDYYCSNGGRKLRQVVDLIIGRNFPWIPQMDYDDFYSIAGQLVWECENKYDPDAGGTFQSFFMDCLSRKIKTRVTYMNRQKRKVKDKYGNPIADISIYTPIDEEDGTLLIELIASNTNVEAEVLGESESNENIKKYLSNLSKNQRKILYMKMDGFTAQQIQQMLHLTQKQYDDCFQGIRSFKNISLLYRQD